MVDQPLAASSSSEPTAPAKPCFEVRQWEVLPPNLAPLAQGETKASREIRARASVAMNSLPNLATMKAGQEIQLPVRHGQRVTGVVNVVVPDDSGWVRVGGGLAKGAQGSFSLSQKGGEMRGMIVREDTAQA